MIPRPDLLVLEPDHQWHPRVLRRSGQKVLAYLSLGEIHKTRPYYAALAARVGVLASPNPRWPDAVAVDPGAPAWWGVVLEEVVPQILAQGYDGLFLDTLDDAGSLVRDQGQAGSAYGCCCYAMPQDDTAVSILFHDPILQTLPT